MWIITFLISTEEPEIGITGLVPGKNEIISPSWSPCGNYLAMGYSPYSYIHPVRNLCAIMGEEFKAGAGIGR